MALIELNLEKPALKRTELVEESEVETAEEPETETETAEAEETDVEETKGGSKVRTFARRAAVLGGTAAGLAAVRKLRQKRGGTDEEQQELEEDWQTAE
ncbi:hypothetical protein [Haladaptatus sp. T7]|uniref:hypothetical protein n=1 Tax=Haladaptatus sp. T7 TaxID=2029368 RepID=UPI0021A25227|nr:hypothetical protein [Haladaptatus sp. T7]GKZ13156.1 hypothetical protein HAL_10370 [Haladaptatus sp. T7]